MKKNKKSASSGGESGDDDNGTRRVIALHNYCAGADDGDHEATSTDAVDALIDTMPKEVIVRCLRRRFWRALVTEEADDGEEEEGATPFSSSSSSLASAVEPSAAGSPSVTTMAVAQVSLMGGQESSSQGTP